MSLSFLPLIKRLANYLFFGNLFIALCAVCLTAATCRLLHTLMPAALGWLIFAATAFLYNFDSLLPQKLHQFTGLSERRSWVLGHQKYLSGLLIVTGSAAVFFFTQLQLWQHSLLIGHLFLLSIFYSVPVIPTSRGWRPLRDIPLLKIFLIAYVWTCVTVWLPWLVLQQKGTQEIGLLLFAQRFLFILPITIIFDIRDMARDKQTVTLTLPGWLGITQAKYGAGLVLLFFLLLVIFKPIGDHQPSLILSGVITAFVIAQATETRNEYFYAIAADGMMALQFLLLLLL